MSFLKRGLSGFVWLLAVWSGYRLVGLVVDIPAVVGPLLGFAVATFVMIDPQGLLWPSASRRVHLLPGVGPSHSEPSSDLTKRAA